MDWRIEHYPELASTSDLVRERAEQGEPAGLVVVAQHQTSGRGRQGRSWHSPDGGLYLTCLLRPRVAQPLTSLAAGIAVAESLEAEGARLKWPNDVVINGKKVAGILVEGRWGDQQRPAWVAIGIGVNTGQIPVPDHIPATSVAQSREELLHALLPQLARWLEQTDEAIVHRWRTLNVTLGQTVTIRRAEGTVTGVAQDIDPSGHLLLLTEKGPLTVCSGWLT